MSSLAHRDFEALYRQHAGPLLAFLAGRVQPRADVPDVAQDIWSRVWHHRASFTGGNFRAWLFQIARNLLIDRARRPQLEALPADHDAPDARLASPDVTLMDQEVQERLRRCLDRLRPEERELVSARLGGESYEDLSVRLKLTAQQAHRLFHTAKTRLQECVGQADEP
jgi:RNA polymerase sigma-70 factor (ECF subfamily)